MCLIRAMARPGRFDNMWLTWSDDDGASLVTYRFRSMDAMKEFVRHPEHAAQGLFNELRERQIIVRYFNKPRISEYLRISVGTDAHCDALVSALRKVLG